VSADLVRTELRRAVARFGDEEAKRQAEHVILRTRLVALDTVLLDRAGVLPPVGLRSLDAVHVVCAGVVAGRLRTLVTYDDRMAEAARAAGLPVAHPGRS